jgi:hypothetical protein
MKEGTVFYVNDRKYDNGKLKYEVACIHKNTGGSAGQDNYYLKLLNRHPPGYRSICTIHRREYDSILYGSDRYSITIIPNDWVIEEI